MLDTNVVSELMRPAPDSNVLTWVDNQVSDTLVSTAITIAGILYGIAGLRDSSRKTALRAVKHQT